MTTIHRSIRLFLLAFLVASTSVLADSDNPQAVWIDVRSIAEYEQSHIVGDTRITHTDIVPGVSRLYPDKDTPIHLYCRSGGRAGMARQALLEAGYRNVTNAGGIDEARAARGLQ